MDEEPQINSEVNPYQTPIAAPVSSLEHVGPEEIKPFVLSKSIFRWMLICGVSAAPSFFIAMSLANKPLIQILAMLGGVLTFVVFYVYIESMEWTRRKMKDRSFRLAVIVGYVTRIVISVIFPIAIFVDMFCGLFSVSVTSAIFGSGVMMQEGASFRNEGGPFLFAWFYATTLVQGIVLNVVLGAYTLIVYAITVVIRGSER